MSLIRADIEGLSALAAMCVEQVGVIRGVEHAPAVGRSVQATAAAVSVVHEGVAAAGAKFMARMRSTADDVALAAHEYALTEMDSAFALSDV